MKTIEERANEFALKTMPYSPYVEQYTQMYIDIAKEQKAIDDAQINELKAIVDLTASVMGIGTKWFNAAARMDATMELREKIMKYYE